MNKLTNFIIPQYDSRYGKLGKLYKKYSLDNIMLHNDNGCVYYRIPKELVLKEYITESIEILKDPDESDIWSNTVSCYSLSRVLNKTCNLTVQEYYDLCVDHRNCILNRPRCCNCGQPISFSGWVTHGYSCSDTGNYYCSRFCQNQYQLWLMYNNIEDYPNVQSRLSKGGDDLNSFDSIVKRLRSGFISYGDIDDECHLYIALTSSGKFKYGAVTDLDTRVRTSTYEDTYVKAKIVYTDTRMNIANLEALIKYELNEVSEYLEFNKTMFDFRQAFRRAVTRLNTNDFEF